MTTTRTHQYLAAAVRLCGREIAPRQYRLTLSQRSIANALGISIGTLRHHLTAAGDQIASTMPLCIQLTFDLNDHPHAPTPTRDNHQRTTRTNASAMPTSGPVTDPSASMSTSGNARFLASGHANTGMYGNAGGFGSGWSTNASAAAGAFGNDGMGHGGPQNSGFAAGGLGRDGSTNAGHSADGAQPTGPEPERLAQQLIGTAIHLQQLATELLTNAHQLLAFGGPGATGTPAATGAHGTHGTTASSHGTTVQEATTTPWTVTFTGSACTGSAERSTSMPGGPHGTGPATSTPQGTSDAGAGHTEPGGAHDHRLCESTDGPGDGPGGVFRARNARTARANTQVRAASARKAREDRAKTAVRAVSVRALTDVVSQSESSLNKEKLTDCLSNNLETREPQAREVPRERSAREQSVSSNLTKGLSGPSVGRVAGAELAEPALLDALSGLLERCRRAHLPGPDRAGMDRLRKYTVDEIRVGARHVGQMMDGGGGVRKPFGLLISVLEREQLPLGGMAATVGPVCTGGDAEERGEDERVRLLRTQIDSMTDQQCVEVWQTTIRPGLPPVMQRQPSIRIIRTQLLNEATRTQP